MTVNIANGSVWNGWTTINGYLKVDVEKFKSYQKVANYLKDFTEKMIYTFALIVANLQR